MHSPRHAPTIARFVVGFGPILAALCALACWLSPATARADDAPALPQKAAHPAPTEDVDPNDHVKQTFHVGTHIQRLSKLELGPGTFEVDFLVGYRCDKEPCTPRPTVANGEVKGKVELVVDEPLHKVYRIKADLNAEINLSEFPFDHHELPIQLADRDGLDVILIADPKELAGKDDFTLAGWEVVSTTSKVESDELGDGLTAQLLVRAVTVKRPGIAAVVKNFLPAFVMVLVLFVSMFMKPKMAAPRLAAGTGSFVAVIMFHNIAAGQLPPLGFLTVLDKFMLSLYLLWVLHITVSVLILRADDAKDEALGLKLYNASFVVLPLVALTGWLLVFLRVV